MWSYYTYIDKSGCHSFHQTLYIKAHSFETAVRPLIQTICTIPNPNAHQPANHKLIVVI